MCCTYCTLRFNTFINVQVNKVLFRFNCFSRYTIKVAIAYVNHRFITPFIWSFSVKYGVLVKPKIYSSVVIKYLSRIISYLPLVDLSTWHFHVAIFVSLNSGRQKYMFTFFEVVNFPAWVSHVFSSDFF